MTARASRCRSVVIALAVLAMAGCRNPFLPAQPELPFSGQAPTPVAPDLESPELVISTLATAFAAKSNGEIAYMAAIADTESQGVDFHVDFDPGVVADRTAQNITVPTWNRTLEKGFFRYMVALQKVDGHTIGSYAFACPQEQPSLDITDGDNRVVFDRAYTLTSIQGGVVTDVSHGRAKIEMRQIEPKHWVITRWTDTADPAGPDPAREGFRCFSRLRIDSYNQP